MNILEHHFCQISLLSEGESQVTKPLQLQRQDGGVFLCFGIKGYLDLRVGSTTEELFDLGQII